MIAGSTATVSFSFYVNAAVKAENISILLLSLPDSVAFVPFSHLTDYLRGFLRTGPDNVLPNNYYTPDIKNDKVRGVGALNSSVT